MQIHVQTLKEKEELVGTTALLFMKKLSSSGKVLVLFS